MTLRYSSAHGDGVEGVGPGGGGGGTSKGQERVLKETIPEGRKGQAQWSMTEGLPVSPEEFRIS